MKLTFAALLLIATAPLALAQGTYTQFDYPGASSTVALAIDGAGEVVGYYADASGNHHGFLLSGGTYSRIDYLTAADTILAGINNNGQIVGFSDSPQAGFVYNIESQTFTKVNAFQKTGTFSQCINDAGTVAGYGVNYSDTRITGFEIVGQVKRIAPSGASETFVNGISASGVLVGYYLDRSGNLTNFSFKAGHYRNVVIQNTSNARITGINPAGTALGGFYSFSENVDAGFVYENGAVTTLQFPSASSTYLYGINNDGEVAGTFADSSGIEHGFTWTPPADAAKK